MAGEPAQTLQANGDIIVLPALRDIKREPLTLPPHPDPAERAEHEAFLLGAGFVLHCFKEAGVAIANIWTDVQQVAYLMYPPYDLPTDTRKIRGQKED